MYNDYLRALLPIPILDIQISKKNNYFYKIITYSQVADESNITVKKRINNCKKIKSFDGWYFTDDLNKKYAIIEFNREDG